MSCSLMCIGGRLGSTVVVEITVFVHGDRSCMEWSDSGLQDDSCEIDSGVRFRGPMCEGDIADVIDELAGAAAMDLSCSVRFA